MKTQKIDVAPKSTIEFLKQGIPYHCEYYLEVEFDGDLYFEVGESGHLVWNDADILFFSTLLQAQEYATTLCEHLASKYDRYDSIIFYAQEILVPHIDDCTDYYITYYSQPVCKYLSPYWLDHGTHHPVHEMFSGLSDDDIPLEDLTEPF